MGEITDKVKGTVKEVLGKATDDDSMRRKGRLQQFSGDVKGVGNDARDEVGEKVDDVRDKLHKRRDRR